MESVIWGDFYTWDPIIQFALGSEVAEAVIVAIRAADTSNYPRDGSDWINLLGKILVRSPEELQIMLADELSSKALRTYHGCRPDDLNTYLTQGIRIHRHGEMEERVRELVRSDPRLAGVDIEKRISEIPREYDQGKIFLTFDGKMLVEQAGHYLIYGSEWISVVLGAENRYLLLERGTPTLIHIDLPASMVSRSILEGYARDLLGEWAKQIVRGISLSRYLDSGVELEADLYLKASPGVIEKRIDTTSRGIVGLKDTDFVSLYAEREKLYLHYADVEIDVSEKTPEEIATDFMKSSCLEK